MESCSGGWGAVTDKSRVLASVGGVRILVYSKAAPSLSMPLGLCHGKLTKLLAFGKHLCEVATDNPEKIDRGLRLHVKEPGSEKKTSVKAGVSLM